MVGLSTSSFVGSVFVFSCFLDSSLSLSSSDDSSEQVHELLSLKEKVQLHMARNQKRFRLYLA